LQDGREPDGNGLEVLLRGVVVLDGNYGGLAVTVARVEVVMILNNSGQKKTHVMQTSKVMKDNKNNEL
jgi:hypothetical protein